MSASGNQLVPLSSDSRSGWLHSRWLRYQKAHWAFHVVAPLVLGAIAGVILQWAWTVLDRGEYGVAMLLVLPFVVLGTIAALALVKRWLQILAVVLVVLITGYSGAKIWHEKADKPWFPLFARPAPTPAPISANALETAVEKGITKSQRMELTMDIIGVSGVSVADSLKMKNMMSTDSPLHLLLGVTLVNSGNVPTAAHGWASLLEIEGKGEFEGSTVQFASNNDTIDLNGPHGAIVKYSLDDFLTVKINKPIPPGETVPGLLMFKFDQLVTRDVVPPVRICVQCSDSQHKRHGTCLRIERLNHHVHDFAVPGLRPKILEKGR